MAIAPVNKFLTVAVPVAPGEQKLYEVPTGTTAILLYAQVSNVGIGQTYPTATLIHKMETFSVGRQALPLIWISSSNKTRFSHRHLNLEDLTPRSLTTLDLQF